MTESQVERVLDRLGMTPALKALLVCSCIGYVLDAFDNGLIGYAMPLMSVQLKISNVVAGYVLSAGLWGGVLGQFAWGWVAQMRGRLFALKGTLLTFAVFTGLTALASSAPFVFAARFLTGAGLNGFVPVDAVMVSECAPTRRRGSYTALIAVLWPVGAIAGLLVSLYVLPRAGWRWLFVIGVLPALFLPVMQRRITESPRWLVNGNRVKDAIHSLVRLGATKEMISEQMECAGPEPAVKQPGSAAALLSREHIGSTAIAWMLWLANLYASMSLIAWLPSYFVQVHHMSLVSSLSYTLITTVCGFGGRLVGIKVIETMGRKVSIGYSLLAASCCMLAFGFVKNQLLLLGMAMLLYFFNEQASVCEMAYIPELFPTGLRMQGTAWCSASARMVAATSPIVVGYLLAAHHYTSIFVVFALSLFIPCLIVLHWGPETKGKGLTALSSE